MFRGRRVPAGRGLGGEGGMPGGKRKLTSLGDLLTRRLCYNVSQGHLSFTRFKPVRREPVSSRERQVRGRFWRARLSFTYYPPREP